MIVGVATDKGGAAKTTTAICLSGVLAETGQPTGLFDGDKSRTATKWFNRGRARGYASPFDVAPVEAAAMIAANYDHRVLDTAQAPTVKDLVAVAQYSDVLVLPTAPEAFDMDGLEETIAALREIAKPDGSPVVYRVLFTRVEHHQEREVRDIRAELADSDIPMFQTTIPYLKVFKRAALRGMLVRDVRDDEMAPRAWAAYQALGEELLHGTR